MILALTTSSGSGGVALLDGKRLVAELTAGEVGAHSTWLLKSVKDLLENAGLKTSDIGLIALDKGPGAFTGLRIGISTAKGLAWSLNKKIIGVSTLKALAMNLGCSEMAVCPVLDARKGEVYAALYRFKGGEIKTLMQDSALTPQRLVDSIKRLEAGPVIFLGNGLGPYSGIIKANLNEAVFAQGQFWLLRAYNIGLLASGIEDSAVLPSDMAPAYLRQPEAELKRARP